MTTRPLNSVKGRAIASLLGGGLLTIALQSAVCAQTASYACEPSLEVKRALQKLPAADDARVSSSRLREQRTTILSPLLAKRPLDLFIHREYQESINILPRDNDRELLLQKYHTLLAKHPRDPRFLYLYGRLLIGRRTGEGVEFLRQALQRAPNFPWAHLALAESYQLRTYQDKDRAAAHLKTFMKLCPTSLEAYKYLKQVNDQDLLDAASQRLRMLLQRQADPKALTYYKTIWALEFRVKPPAEHPQLRQQVEEDLQRLRRRNLLSDKNLVLTLGAGYKIISDQDGVRWADEQILRSFPYSLQAMNLLMERWQDAHPYPGPASSREQREAYRQAEWQATDEWSRRWPDHPHIWSRRFLLAFNHQDTPRAQTEAAIDGYLNAMEKYSEMSNSDDLLNIAWVYWGRGMRQERIPELVQKSFQEAELFYQLILKNDALPPEAKKGFQRTLTLNYWKGWGFLLPTYLKGKQYENARDVLSQIAAYLSKEDPGQAGADQEKRSYSSHQASYWMWMARLAEAENRKQDALSCYQKALEARPRRDGKPSPDAPDSLVDRTRQLWKELGGTNQGWQDWFSHSETAKTITVESRATNWEKQNRTLPDFELVDLQGRKWRLADLKGKVSFVNLWATWCGPCHVELPEVQKLQERLKEQPDVLVLTLNLDFDIGLVEPFLKQNGYTFPVIPATAYLEKALPTISLPLNWVINKDGVVQMEQRGFIQGDPHWLDQVFEVIQKVRAAK